MKLNLPADTYEQLWEKAHEAGMSIKAYMVSVLVRHAEEADNEPND